MFKLTKIFLLGLIKLLGPKVIGEFQDRYGAKCYFNTLIPFEDGLIKYGVISRNNIISDLLDWESLYIAGRLQKPVRMVKETQKEQDSELHMALRMNLKNALHVALLMLPEMFPEDQLYKKLVGLSYEGDFRMAVGEDKGKVKKITQGSFTDLQRIYANQLTKMSDFIYESGGKDRKIFQQDMSPGARHFHLTMLPKNMQEILVSIWNRDGKWRDVEDVLRSAAYHRDVDQFILECLQYVVARPAMVQATKGVVSAGFKKTVIYSSQKVKKMMSNTEVPKMFQEYKPR